ncbi:MAG: hypothetical protein M3680_32480 [Myxococcota bacterium]|nr:hypothetical protein [Myxococcota bacterium]
MSATVHQISQPVTVVARTLDAVDRAHARAAMVLHTVRNDVRTKIERSLERAELVTTKVFERARKGVERADHVSADAVNRAQGVVGHAIEKARVTREKRQHAS